MQPADDRRDRATGLGAARHWGGFLVSGAIAFCLDAGTLEFGVRVVGLDPLVARLFGISVAVVGAWLSHRTLTFAVTENPTVSEFARYAAAAGTTAAINYTVFAATLVVWPQTPRLVALIGASIVATIFSYLSMRYGVFRRSRG